MAQPRPLPADDGRDRPLRIHTPPDTGPLRFTLAVEVPEGARPGDVIDVPVVAWHAGAWERIPPARRPARAYPIPDFGFAAYPGAAGV